MSQQELHESRVAGLRRSYERRGSGFEEPLHREDGPGLRVSVDSGIYICATVQKDLDVVQMIHIGLWNREVAAFDVAIVGRQIERRETGCGRRQIDIGTMLDKV